MSQGLLAISGVGGFIGAAAEAARRAGWRVRGLELSPAAAAAAPCLGDHSSIHFGDAWICRTALAPTSPSRGPSRRFAPARALPEALPPRTAHGTRFSRTQA